jgi:hypothetical protein
MLREGLVMDEKGWWTPCWRKRFDRLMIQIKAGRFALAEDQEPRFTVIRQTATFCRV